MDEVEAALDDVNLHRFLDLLHEFRGEAQLIIVSHQKRTMEAADALYGVTMTPGGSSKVVSQKVESTTPTRPGRRPRDDGGGDRAGTERRRCRWGRTARDGRLRAERERRERRDGGDHSGVGLIAALGSGAMIALWIVLAVVVVAALAVAVTVGVRRRRSRRVPGHRRGPAPPAGSSSRSAGRAPGPAARTAAPPATPSAPAAPPTAPAPPEAGVAEPAAVEQPVEAEEVVGSTGPAQVPRADGQDPRSARRLRRVHSGSQRRSTSRPGTTSRRPCSAPTSASPPPRPCSSDLQERCRPSRSGTPTAWSTRCARTCSRR